MTPIARYQLAELDGDPDVLVERLGEAGCDDALPGIGKPGRLALEFTRESDSAQAAVRSALADVARQNMRKLMLARPGTFPAAVHEGSASVLRSGIWPKCSPGWKGMAATPFNKMCWKPRGQRWRSIRAGKFAGLPGI